MTASSTSRLTDHDRDIIGRARKLEAVSGADAVREHTGEADIGMAYATAYGDARWSISELLGVIERLGGGNG